MTLIVEPVTLAHALPSESEGKLVLPIHYRASDGAPVLPMHGQAQESRVFLCHALSSQSQIRLSLPSHCVVA